MGAIIATVEPTNAASVAVLARVGGFRWIGSCRDGDVDEHVFRRDL